MVFLHTDCCWFIDGHGRKVILRGVNLSGSCKIPFQPDGDTHLKEHWPPLVLTQISFKGRPLQEDEADEHLSRLKAWGFNCLRFLVTWEAIEPAGPYQYDEDYLDYIARMVQKAGDYGFYLFIDPHQDVWSRVTGGDGMPLWLFDKIGLDYTRFDEAGLVGNMQYLWDSDPKKNNYRPMQWGENLQTFPNGTMWTLFFGGRDFTPNLMLTDEETGDILNVQDYLQKHFVQSLIQIAKRVQDFPNVLGFDTLNEPSHGFIGHRACTRNLEANKQNKLKDPPMPGLAWTPVDGMFAAAGHSFPLERVGVKITKMTLGVVGKSVVNPKRISIWKQDAEDFWKTHSVWGEDSEGHCTCVNDDFFRIVRGKPVDFLADYLTPFAHRVADGVRQYNADWLLFVEDEPHTSFLPRADGWPQGMPANMVNTYHWYEPALSYLRKFLWPVAVDINELGLIWGMKGIEKLYIRQLSIQHNLSKTINQGNTPCLVGEFGCHMNLQNGRGYRIWKKTHNQAKAFKWQTIAIDLMFNALDALWLSGTYWNYTAENNNTFGDLWNQEDLSLFSRDQQDKSWQEDINSGGRAVLGFCRPYARAIAGNPIKMQFKRGKGVFLLEYTSDPKIDAPTEIFVPSQQYPTGCEVKCEGGSWTWNEDHSLLSVCPIVPEGDRTQEMDAKTIKLIITRAKLLVEKPKEQ